MDYKKLSHCWGWMQIHKIMPLVMVLSRLKTRVPKSASEPWTKWKECKYISASGEKMFLRRQGDDSKPPESFVAKSQHFSWKKYSITEQPFVLTPHGCLQTKCSASDWHKLQAAARNQAGPFYSFLVCYFFQSLKGTSHSLDESTEKSRWQHHLQPEWQQRMPKCWLMASSPHKSLWTQLYPIG